MGGTIEARSGGDGPSRRAAADPVGSSRNLSPARNDRGAAFASALAALLPTPTLGLDLTRARRGSFRLAGFAVLCDWIGSNESWFHYRDPEAFESLPHYWSYARERADRAIAEAGVIPAASAPPRTFAELTAQSFEPSPMQQWAAEVALPEGPLLAVLEDETGSGKTEAALMLAHRLIASGRAEGIYLALPTMATANAMFERCRRVTITCSPMALNRLSRWRMAAPIWWRLSARQHSQEPAPAIVMTTGPRI